MARRAGWTGSSKLRKRKARLTEFDYSVIPASGRLMVTIHIGKVILTKALSSRPSARLLEQAVSDAALSSDSPELAFDLCGKLAMAPTFFDELIRIVREQSQPPGDPLPRIELVNVPSTASSKFHAVCRSHHLTLNEPSPGHWIISNWAIPNRKLLIEH